MFQSNFLDILKGAILLEHKGKALYESAVYTTKVPEVAELFRMLAGEEEKHIQILRREYSHLLKGEGFDTAELEGPPPALDKILTEKITKEISGAGYEAAAISAALDFEKKAVEYYSEQAKAVDVKGGQKLYSSLAEWEKSHMQMLARIDSHLKEEIWFDNRFWPH